MVKSSLVFLLMYRGSEPTRRCAATVSSRRGIDVGTERIAQHEGGQTTSLLTSEQLRASANQQAVIDLHHGLLANRLEGEGDPQAVSRSFGLLTVVALAVTAR